MSLPTGTKLGPYEILAQIGAGGMGEVYKARDTRLDRTVALKILPQRNDPDRKQRFEREARVVSQLHHPHICTLFDLGSQDGIEYLVMEFLEGQTLAQRLEKGPIPLPDLVRYAAEIAAALDHAHQSERCHRDLKPANVMLTKTGIKLLDFGLARALGREASPPGGETATVSLTREGVILGTLPYMSPEQLEGKSGDARSDIFAFGAVMYEMATGRRAFAGSSGASVITQIMSCDPPSMREVQPVTPVGLERIVKRCLAKDPEQRWQNARDIASALELVSDEPGAAPQTQKRANRQWIPWALFAIAMLAVGLAYYWRETTQAGTVTLTIPPPPDSAFSGLGGPAVSPDGNRIAFVASNSRVARVWIRSLNNLQSRPLAGTEGASSMFWSADGKTLAFTAGGKLKRVPAEGGVAQVICDASNLRGGSWGKDGIIVFAPNVQTNLYRISASGGDPAPVTTMDASLGENSHRWPQFLPDGKRFLYYARTGNPTESGIYAGWADPAKRSDRKLILKTESNAMYAPLPEGVRGLGYLIYLRDRTLLAQPFDTDRLVMAGEPTVIAERVAESTPLTPGRFFATSRLLIYGGQGGGSSNQLVWFDRSGKRLSEITTGDGSYGQPSLSPDGKRIAAVFMGPQINVADVFIVDIARNIPTRLTFGGLLTRRMIWSPDGNYVAYRFLTNGRPSLVKKRIDGSSSEEVISAKATGSPCDWSRDGKWILYMGSGAVWYVSATGEGEPRPFLQTKAQEACGQFSPDGKWVAYGSDESGEYQIYVQAFPSGGKRQVSRDRGIQPRWRGDGKELFFLSSDSDAVMAVDIRAGAAIESGIPRKLFDAMVESRQGTIDYAVTADGQKFIIPTETRASVAEPITAILNWTSLIKK